MVNCNPECNLLRMSAIVIIYGDHSGVSPVQQ
jgi:hypothetical protein